eukprot:jgi/Mesvir1/16870/Mv15754-RA.1
MASPVQNVSLESDHEDDSQSEGYTPSPEVPAKRKRVSEEDKQFVCDECSKRYVNAAGLRKHVRERHEADHEEQAAINAILEKDWNACKDINEIRKALLTVIPKLAKAKKASDQVRENAPALVSKIKSSLANGIRAQIVYKRSSLKSSGKFNVGSQVDAFVISEWMKEHPEYKPSSAGNYKISFAEGELEKLLDHDLSKSLRYSGYLSPNKATLTYSAANGTLSITGSYSM